MTAAPIDRFWFEQYQDSEQRVRAACRAVGQACSLLTPDHVWDDAERLIRLRDVLRELRQELGLPGPASFDRTNTETNTDTTTNAGNSGEAN